MLASARRNWRLPLLVGLTLLLAVPLWQLSSHVSTDYYQQDLYNTVSRYFSLLEKDHDSNSDRNGSSSSSSKNESNTLDNDTVDEKEEDGLVSQFRFSSPCDGFPDTTNITFVMKTGATEAHSKLTAQILSSLQCIPDTLIFSDKEDQIGQHHIYDALDRVNETIKKENKEFELYEALRNCAVAQSDCTKDMSGGWDLDKYKFLNMLERAWAMRPHQDWYVFAEADTYILWSNLVYWLREKAAPRGGKSNKDNELLYVGSVSMVNDFPFAHGGSGYVLSGSMVRKMVEDIPNIGAKYDEVATHECCGDLLMSFAVDEAGGKVKQAHPMFNGEKPSTLPYGPGQWCQPLLTMHHMLPEDISMVWQYEQMRTKKSEIIQIKDMYYTFMQSHLTSLRTNWDNLSDDTCYIGESKEEQERADDDAKGRQKKEEDKKNSIEKRAHKSPSDCARVCVAAGLDIPDAKYDAIKDDDDNVAEAERDKFVRAKWEKRRRGDKKWARGRTCFQWRYHKGACCTAESFKLGRPRREEDDDEWTSGWFVEGIEDWIKARGECKGIAWRDPD